MAEVVWRDVIARTPGLAGRVEVTSAGTARWHVGKPMDSRARRALDRAGFDDPGTLGAFADREYLLGHDLILVMTREHRDDVRARAGEKCPPVELLRNYLTPGLDLDLADPYYGDDAEFDACLAQIRESALRWTEEFRQQWGE
jgi:protein-tyrosine phosphatase